MNIEHVRNDVGLEKMEKKNETLRMRKRQLKFPGHMTRKDGLEKTH